MALFFYKEKNKDIRAAAYLRLSIEDGDKAESNSIGNQRELIRDFAAERPGLHLIEEYADDGYTGTNFERPGFKRMMEDIKSGKINCIIVKDLSRLGRNYIEMGKYLEQIFPMMGIRFIAINDNYDNANTESSDSDSIVVPFKNLLNDSYCRDISIKVRSQLDMKRRKGEFIGGYAIYGYCKDKRNKNRLVVDEYAADIVRSIYRRKLEGMSAQAIAEQLNSENVLAPSEYKRLCGLNYHSGFKAGTHAKWQAIQVLRILKNEVYTGTMVQGRRQKINYKIVQLSDKRKVLKELQKFEDVQNPVYRAKGEIMSLTDKVSQMAKKREQLYADYVAGVVDSEDYQLIREDYSRQYDGLRAALQEAENKKAEVERQIEEYLNMTSHLEEHLDNFEFDIQLVKSLVQKIEVSADKRIRIVFGFQDVFTEFGKESAET